jgi:hypothetical protein
MSNTWSVQFLDDEDDLNEANGGFFFLKEAWQQAQVQANSQAQRDNLGQRLEMMGGHALDY